MLDTPQEPTVVYATATVSLFDALAEEATEAGVRAAEDTPAILASLARLTDEA